LLAGVAVSNPSALQMSASRVCCVFSVEVSATIRPLADSSPTEFGVFD